MKIRSNTAKTALLITSLTGYSATPALAETSNVTVYSDVIGAAQLLEENYATALEEMAEAKGENPIFLNNNLCAAHLLTQKLAQAQTSCSAALASAQRAKNYGGWLQRTQATGVRRLYRDRAIEHLRALQLMQTNRVAQQSTAK